MDFSGLRFDISTLPVKRFVIDAFPVLAEYSEFKSYENDELLRIAILATDEKSPFVKLEREDYERRLQKIFEYLKIKDDVLLAALNLGHKKEYEAMVNRLFILTDNLAYVMYSNKFRMFHYISLSLREPPDMKNIIADMNKRAALDKNLKEVYDDLINYEAQVFSDIPTRKKIKTVLAKLLQPAEAAADSKQVI